jgi:hypothetical protein
MSRTFTYALRDAANGNKLVGGMLHAETIEAAARKAIAVNKLTIRRRIGRFHTDTDFLRDGRKVYLSVGVPPEYFLDAAPCEDIRCPD